MDKSPNIAQADYPCLKFDKNGHNQLRANAIPTDFERRARDCSVNNRHFRLARSETPDTTDSKGPVVSTLILAVQPV